MNVKALCALALLGSIVGVGAQDRSASRMVEWPYVAGDQGAMRYSPLTDLNADTVKRLELAWQWKAPDRPMPDFGTTPGNFTSTPLMIDNVLYVTTNYNRLVALDADSGAEKWSYDPKAYEAGIPTLAGGFRHRGVAAWHDGPKLRIFLASRYRLLCIDAATGTLVPSFGNKGVLDLTVGLPKAANKEHFEYNSAPVVYKNLVIVGGASGDSLIYHNAPTGDVRAYDATTGKQAWIFHVVPQEGEPGRETWENDSWKFTGKTTAWAGVTVDESRGLVYVPVGEPNNNYYGGRRLGDNLYADSVVCLDATTGKRKWHFQTLHHPLFDYDLPAQPNLMTITVGGKKIDAVAQITKQGLLFVFDRVTGKPVWPIEERRVPESEIPGERTARTQPFPTKPPPFAASQGVELEDAFDLTPELKTAAQAEMKKYRLGPLYTPGSLEGTLTQPGGANWGGGAFDPETGLLYIKTSSNIGVLKLEKFDPATSRNPFAKTNEDVGYDTARSGGGGSFKGIPLNKPPYAHLVAVDMNKGDIAWRVPFGAGSKSLRANPALKDVALPARLGSPGAPGSIVTKGGLVFVGGGDSAFYAFDKATGKEVWSAPIPRPTTATPMTYRSRAGRQFVVIATGSGSDQVLMAFAVPAGTPQTP